MGSQMNYLQEFAVLAPILLIALGAAITVIWKIMRAENKFHNQRIIELLVAVESHKTSLNKIEALLQSLKNDFEIMKEKSWKQSSQIDALFRYVDSPKRASER